MLLHEILNQAKSIQGWMSETELDWLATTAAKKSLIIEVGSWKGRSTKALAMATSGVVYAVDHWKGSTGSDSLTNQEVTERGSETIFQLFQKNLAPEIALGKVIIVHSERLLALQQLQTLLAGKKADLIFIDADHLYEMVQEDITNYLPLLAPNGILSGHDYSNTWLGVKRAVDERFSGRIGVCDTIWAVTPSKIS